MRAYFRRVLTVSLLAFVVCIAPCSNSQAATYDQEDYTAYTTEFQQKLQEQASQKMKDAFKQIRCYEKRMNDDKERKKQKDAGKKATPFADDTWPDLEAAKGMTDKLGADLFDGCSN